LQAQSPAYCLRSCCIVLPTSVPRLASVPIQNPPSTGGLKNLGPGVLNPEFCKKEAAPPPLGPPSSRFYPASPASWFKSSQAKQPADNPAFISKSCYQESHQDSPKMKGFLFLLLTISLLVMIQIQTGVLGNTTTAATTTKKPKSATPPLSSLSGGSVLLFLANILVQFFYLS
uniref:CAMPATH-1 antigen n=1 Tax=Felis catus TaxID=9685 RepID=A0ABI8AHL1_FELCA